MVYEEFIKKLFIKVYCQVYNVSEDTLMPVEISISPISISKEQFGEYQVSMITKDGNHLTYKIIFSKTNRKLSLRYYTIKYIFDNTYNLIYDKVFKETDSSCRKFLKKLIFKTISEGDSRIKEIFWCYFDIFIKIFETTDSLDESCSDIILKIENSKSLRSFVNYFVDLIVEKNCFLNFYHNLIDYIFDINYFDQYLNLITQHIGIDDYSWLLFDSQNIKNNWALSKDQSLGLLLVK